MIKKNKKEELKIKETQIEQEEINEEQNTPDMVDITLPIDDAIGIAMGKAIENEVIRRYIRNSIISQCGPDEFIQKMDMLMVSMNGLIEDQNMIMEEQSRKIKSLEKIIKPRKKSFEEEE